MRKDNCNKPLCPKLITGSDYMVQSVLPALRRLLEGEKEIIQRSLLLLSSIKTYSDSVVVPRESHVTPRMTPQTARNPLQLFSPVASPSVTTRPLSSGILCGEVQHSGLDLGEVAESEHDKFKASNSDM